ncbi:MAG: glycosyltransferase [Deltaproteobacteria bacterium]|jgi:3-deoxy-D-manno-octulosonic-acid transferase|nr:glycosyltransferase [Deltaproteobacteria bacterium]
MRAIYQAIYFLGFLLSSPWWVLRGIANPERLRVTRARLLGPPRILPKLDGRKRAWVHALSLGEVHSARELVRELKAKGLDVVVTSTTVSGLAMARASFPGLPVLPSPLDFRLSLKRFLKSTDPDFLIIVETDVWPGALAGLKRRNIPASLVSARLSPRSFANYRRIRFFWKGVLSMLSHIAAQTEEDRENFIILGAPPDKVGVAGNLKFDQGSGDPDPSGKERILKEAGWPEGRYILAGSTHTGEERLIVKAYLAALAEHPELKLCVAPRDRQRFARVWRLLQEACPGHAARRSEPEATPEGAKVFLLDSLGELERFYAICDIAIIGKSFPGPHEGGGHNPLEASAKGKPVLTGPRCHNFKWMYQALLKCGAAEIVEAGKLSERLGRLLDDPAGLKAMGEEGRDFTMAHRGAAKRTLALVDPEDFGEPEPLETGSGDGI